MESEHRYHRVVGQGYENVDGKRAFRSLHTENAQILSSPVIVLAGRRGYNDVACSDVEETDDVHEL